MYVINKPTNKGTHNYTFMKAKSEKIISKLEVTLGRNFEKGSRPFYEDSHYDLDANGNIIKLNLRHTEIQTLNKIIDIIAEIETLQSLDLSYNNLQSIALLKRIPSLIELSIDHNSIKDLSALSKLPNLNILNASYNPINNVDHINKLDSLQELNIEFCRNLDFIQFRNKRIKSLNISNTGLRNIEFLNELSNLNILLLNKNHNIDYNTIEAMLNIKEIHLEHNKIKDFSILSKFNKIEKANLSNNLINEIDNTLDLSDLSVLHLDNNNIKDIHPLAKYLSLSSIRLIKNRINDLTDLNHLCNIKSIYLNENLINSIKYFKDLKKLHILFLGSNKISDISHISDMTQLTELNLGENGITDISPLSKLVNLNTLFLYENRIKDISPLRNLTSITRLWLSDNLIEEIPLWITNLKSNISSSHFGGDSIDLEGNPIKSPPIEIVEQGNDAIRNYYEQLENQQLDYLFEAKLLILGEPGAGKTSMAWKIENSECDLPKEEDTTRGIDVRQYYFPLKIGDYPTFKQPEKLVGKQFRVNMWDFGGQEIYKATHRFFLSKRSLYVLVTDSRNENTDFNYWLHIVEMFGGHSPLLIVINEKHNRKRTIDIDSMRRRFANIVDVIEVDFSEKGTSRIKTLLKEIRHYTTKLEHVGSSVPARWTQVREAIESNGSNTISIQDYISICKEKSIIKLSDTLLLSQYFHDIGVFLHFQDDEVLKNTIFINSNWATNAVYKILDHPLLNQQYGRFSKQDAITIWSEEEYELIRSELLQLMKKFFLAYEIKQSGQYIVPERLPDSQPKYSWSYSDNLFLRYEYDFFMPKGILSQFIVQLHNYIDNHNYVWRRGVVLQRDETVAEVIETYDSRSLRIRVAGKHKRDFLTILIYEFDKINKLYEKIKVQKMIPCNCGICQDEHGEPNFYHYDDLKRRIEKGREEVECQVSYTMVNVKSLIDDIMQPSSQDVKKNDDKASVKGKVIDNIAKPTKVFISYSHKDKRWLSKVQTRFKALNNLGVKIEAWDDTKLTVGGAWRSEIKQAIDSSKISILLISDDFLASDFIMNNELPPLLKSAKNDEHFIVPIILRPCLYDMHNELKEIQSFNPPDKALSGMKSSEQEKYFVSLMKFINTALNVH